MDGEHISGPIEGDAQARVLFFARGFGRAHAVRAMEIAAEIRRLGSDASFTFVSYGAGAETFRQREMPIIDLDLPDAGAMWPTVVRAGRLLREAPPDLVLSCEEFAVLPAAKITNTPTVFLGDWFTGPRTPAMQALVFADEIIFAGNQGVFQEPPCVKDKVHYAGPLLRTLSYSRSDRERARRELGIAAEATVILVLPGDGSTEQNEPVSHILIPAFDALAASPKLMVWVAGRDYELLQRRFGERPDVIVEQDNNNSGVDRLMAASNLAVTKGDYMTVRELAAMGVPSLSISYGRNPVDDAYGKHIRGNTALEANLLSPAELSICMRDSLARWQAPEGGQPEAARSANGALTNAAERIIRRIDEIKASRKLAALG